MLVTVATRYMYDEYRSYDVYEFDNTKVDIEFFCDSFGFEKLEIGECAISKDHSEEYWITNIR